MLIDGEEGDLQYSHDEELDWAGFTQNGPKGDQNCGCAEVRINHSFGEGRTQEEWGTKC